MICHILLNSNEGFETQFAPSKIQIIQRILPCQNDTLRALFADVQLTKQLPLFPFIFDVWCLTQEPKQFISQREAKNTLLGTHVSHIPLKVTFESMIFLFPRWDMLSSLEGMLPITSRT